MAENRLRIAAQLYTVRAFTKTEEGIAETLKRIKDAGYDCVQVSAFGPYRAEFLRDELGKNGLSVCVTHTAYDRIVGDTENVIREHKVIGCPYIGLGYRILNTQEAVDTLLREIMPAVKKIKDAGLGFVYHNHQNEFHRIDGGKRGMDMLLERTSPEEFGLLPDLYWLQYSGVNPVKFLRENRQRINIVHLKDMSISEEREQRYAEVFEGNMDYDGIGAALKELGIGYAAVEQDECYGKDPFECLARSRENIKKHWGI